MLQDVNATQIIWKPPFMRLTHIAIPGSSSEAHAVFVDPYAISMIGRASPVHTMLDGTKMKGDECTIVHCCHYQLFVEESPEVVAGIRDRTLGHESKPKLTASA